MNYGVRTVLESVSEAELAGGSEAEPDETFSSRFPRSETGLESLATRMLAQRLYKDITESGQYEWMALYEAMDELETPNLLLFLAPVLTPEDESQSGETNHRLNGHGLPEQSLNGHVDPLRAVTELSQALAPATMFNVYHVQKNGTSDAEMRARLTEYIRKMLGGKSDPQEKFIHPLGAEAAL